MMIAYIILAVISLLLFAGLAWILFETVKHIGLVAVSCCILAPVGAIAPMWYLQGLFPTSSLWIVPAWFVCSVGTMTLCVFVGTHYADKH